MKKDSIKTTITKIGNSQGVRLPKTLLAMTGIESYVDMSVEDGAIIIRPAKIARQGWREQFEAMATSEEDSLIDEWPTTEWEKENWEW
jgi:antitoxin MazE